VLTQDIRMDEPLEVLETTQEPVEEEISPDNLVIYLDRDSVSEIGNLVRTEFDADILSRTDYDKRRANWLKLFAGVREKKNFPWPDASNTHLPLLASACLQFQARASEALMPPKQAAKCFATDKRYKDASLRAEKYLNYQLYYEMDEWQEDMDALLLLLPIMGSAYKKTVYDRIMGRVSSRLLTADEFVTPYGFRRLEDCPRKTHVLWKSKNDLMLEAQQGVYVNVEDLPDMPETPNYDMPEYKEQSDKISGQTYTSYFDKRKVLEQHRLLKVRYNPQTNKIEDEDGIQRPYVVTVDYDSGKVLRITPRFYFNTMKNREETFEFFTNYIFIPNPDSHYGFGFGHLLDHINETADTIVNQLIDSGTLANVGAGFINKRSGIKRGDVQFALGQFREVDMASDDIKKAIFHLDFKEPSNTLFTLLGSLQTYAEQVTSTSDWMGGQMPPSDTAATTIIAVIEQGLKVFSSVQKRCHRSLQRELKKIFLLNAVNLNEKVYFTVQDPSTKEMETYQTGRSDFSSPIDVIPVSDPNITSQAERLLKAQQILNEVKSNPLTGQNPQSLYFATKEYLEAFQCGYVDQILPPPKPQEPPDLTPEEENAEFIREVGAHALPQQDHVFHIKSHNAFLISNWGESLKPHGKNLVDAHLKDHLAFAYLQQEQNMKDMKKIGGSSEPVRSIPAGRGGGVETPSGDQGVQGVSEQPD